MSCRFPTLAKDSSIRCSGASSALKTIVLYHANATTIDEPMAIAPAAAQMTGQFPIQFGTCDVWWGCSGRCLRNAHEGGLWRRCDLRNKCATSAISHAAAIAKLNVMCKMAIAVVQQIIWALQLDVMLMGPNCSVWTRQYIRMLQVRPNDSLEVCRSQEITANSTFAEISLGAVAANSLSAVQGGLLLVIIQSALSPKSCVRRRQIMLRGCG